MATATKKADTAKSNNKSKKTSTGKNETVKTPSSKNSAKTIEKPKMTVADGMLEKDTVQKTAKAVTAETNVKAKKTASSNGKKLARAAAKTYSGLDTQTLIGIYRTMYTSRRI